MKKRYSEVQIIKAIKEHEAGAKVDDICRQLGISSDTFYNWRNKYAGLEVNEARRLRELEAENNKLKKLLAEKLLEVDAMKDVLSKKLVKATQRKPVVIHLMQEHKLSERAACRLAGLRRSSFRYESVPRSDGKLRTRLKELAAKQSAYGYLMLHSLLKSEGLVVNKKRTYRIYTEEGHQVRTKKRKKLIRHRQPLELPASVNERWSMDFVSDQLAGGRRFRVLNVVDDYSRKMVGQLVSVSISGRQVSRFLSQLIEQRGKPKKIICDNGTEFTSKAMFFWSKETSVQLGFIQPGKPTQNAFVGSLNGKFRNECLNQHWVRTLDEAKYEIDLWREHYNKIRPHSALGYGAPEEFARQAA